MIKVPISAISAVNLSKLTETDSRIESIITARVNHYFSDIHIWICIFFKFATLILLAMLDEQ